MKANPLRSLASRLSRLLLKIFFRRIELIGRQAVPTDTPVIFILNHPNGLVDPLFILAFGPRDVSFMAKEPLFRTPIIKYFVRAFDCLPVYRKQDGADPRQNIKAMEAARDLLARNGSLAIFPEGTTHDEPQLQTLKTGAARIALAARAMMNERAPSMTPVRLVPVGLYYPAKGSFRSDAVVVYGTAMDVPLVALNDNAAPPRDAVRALTARVDVALRALTVNAADAEHIALAAIAARLLEETASVTTSPGVDGRIHQRLVLMQRILARHDVLHDQNALDLTALITRLRNYRTMMDSHGVDDRLPSEIYLSAASRHLGRTLLGLLLGLPLVLVGVLENYIPYRIIGHLARRVSGGEEEVVSTLKILAGLLLFPVTWLVFSAVVLVKLHWTWALTHLVLAPLCARAALWFLERADITLGGARVLWLSWFGRHHHTKLLAERDAIVAQLLGAAGER